MKTSGSKNILLFLFVIIFAGAGTFFLLNSLAATTPRVFLNPSATTVAPLTEFTVQIKQDSGTTVVNGATVKLTYDATKLDVVSIDKTSSAYKLFIPSNPVGASGNITFSAAAFDDADDGTGTGTPKGPYPVSGEALIATIRFKSKTTAGAADVKFVTGTSLNKPIPDDPSTPDVDETSTANILGTLNTTPGTGNATGGTYTVFIDTAPTSSVTNPVVGTKIKGSITLTANATDAQGVKNVQFRLDNTTNIGTPSPVLTVDANGRYSATWDSKTVADGNHTVTSIATDTGNQTTTSSAISFTVDNTAPNTTISSANPGTTINTTAAFTFTSTEAGSTFECQIDNQTFAACASGKSYSNLALGSHTFNVRAIDSVGNIDATPASQTWTISPPPDTTKPTVSVTAPTVGATVLGTAVPVAATADDNVGVTNVIFYLDYATTKGVLGQDSSAPYNLSPAWNTSTLSNGNHTITAEAYDQAGNIGISTITVSVNNPPPPVDDNPPSVPKNLLSTSASKDSITLQWDESTDVAGTNGAAPSGIANYKLFKSTTVDGQFNLIDTLTGLTKLDTGLSASTKYYYKVQAFDNKGNFSEQSPALEASTTAAPIPIKGDVDGDFKVDIKDLSALVANWGKNYPPADFMKDGTSANVIDIYDLSILLANWGRTSIK